MSKALKTIANDMLGDVRAGAPRSRVKLERGLTLSLTKSGDTYTLTCGRRVILPSPLEMQIVANAFGLLAPEWVQVDIQEWRCYRYSWQWVTVATLLEETKYQ